METGTEEREYLKPLEAAGLLRCGRTKIYEILQTGALPSYKRVPCRLTAWAETG
jgi:predicted DNA-binding transcriptional regulator AlpA